MTLERYYAGDKAFAGLVSAYESEWEKCTFKEELLAAVNGNASIAMVTYGRLRGNALKWLVGGVPALDGLSPKECIKTENGLKRLKECLLRMP